MVDLQKVNGQRLEGCRVIVFGAGAVSKGWGNGRAAAVAYARQGGRVICVDQNEDAGKETVQMIRDEGLVAEFHQADLTQQAQVQSSIDRVASLWGGLDVVHFNVGISSKGGVLELDEASWDRVFAVNLKSAMLVAKCALPLMREQKSGAFVFISSLAALRNGLYSYASYEASKAALQRLSGSLAKENAPFGIRSNTIVPGLIDTPHVSVFVEPDQDPEEVAKKRASQVPLGRQGTAWDIANAAVFLASHEASYITGIDLVVDGGLRL